ncbi:DUF3806 domain-containing protein [Teredinibacter turnerae]|uniref:DUF3806 domain-containing protein n=1 Tax=Teredinibacter turnerae TaxID=2426 RepID=UPI00037989C6|nr:DUF3806 domain-containing protein [Teredinibacter turnerae]
MKKTLLFISLFVGAASPVLALDDEDIASKVLAQHQDGPEIRPLNWLNEKFLERQRNSVNDIVGTHFGQKIQGSKRDLAVLQRIINEKIIKNNETQDLQALGAVLGDVFVHENDKLQWVVYEDELGPTQAVCIKETSHCLFPITMLSRRMEVGLKPNVNKVYESALNDLAEFLPKTPYSVD